MVPTASPAFNGVSGGSPIGAAGYDPNANFTIS